jgi:hypothetical protein
MRKASLEVKGALKEFKTLQQPTKAFSESHYSSPWVLWDGWEAAAGSACYQTFPGRLVCRSKMCTLNYVTALQYILVLAMQRQDESRLVEAFASPLPFLGLCLCKHSMLVHLPLYAIAPAPRHEVRSSLVLLSR